MDTAILQGLAPASIAQVISVWVVMTFPALGAVTVLLSLIQGERALFGPALAPLVRAVLFMVGAELLLLALALAAHAQDPAHAVPEWLWWASGGLQLLYLVVIPGPLDRALRHEADAQRERGASQAGGPVGVVPPPV